MRRKKRGTFFLFIVLAVLLTGVFLKRVQKSPVLTIEDFSPLHLNFEINSVSKIELAGFGREARLFRDKEGWKTAGLGQAQADAEKVAAFLKEFQQARGESRGKGAGLERQLLIRKEEGFSVALEDAKGRALLKCRLSLHPSKKFFFIRLESSGEIFVTDANLTSYLGVSPNGEVTGPEESFWLDADLFRSFAGLQGFTVRAPREKGFENKVSLSRGGKSKNWKYDGDFPAAPDAAKADDFVKTLTALKAIRIRTASLSSAQPLFQIEIRLPENFKKSFSVFPSENPDWLSVCPENSEAVYDFAKADLDKLNRDETFFFSGKLISVDPAKIERLVIHTGKIILPFRPLEKKNDNLEEYLERLSSLKLGRLIRDPEELKKIKTAGTYWIEIKEKDQPIVWLDAGDPLADGMVPLKRRGYKTPFAVSKETFEFLFTNLDRLKGVSPAAAN